VNDGAVGVASMSEPAALPRAELDAGVDVVFDVAATALPVDYRGALRDALVACLPWLADDSHAGIHPLKAAIDGAMLRPSRHTRLRLRADASRVAALLAMRGRELDIGGHPLRLGNARIRALGPSATISAVFVATMADDDLAHERAVAHMLDRVSMPRRFICGRLTKLRCGDDELAGASVVLHGLRPADSLRLQQIGLGPHRALGCGLFVPYKAIAGLE
jgi:CRISPR-associated protein Cas6